MQYCDRPTLVTCLRVNNEFFAEAGKCLYRFTPIIDDSKMGLFFRGALDGILPAEDTTLTCSRYSCSLERRFRWGDVDCGRVTDKEMKTARLDEKFLSMLTKNGLSRVNFKAQLLSYVKVLTVGSHHHCYCHVYGEYAGRLLPNMHTLRVSPAPTGEVLVDSLNSNIVREPLETLCDSNAQCPLMCDLVFHCSKLVFRNLDGQGIVYFDTLYPDPPNLREVVFFVPPCRKRLETPDDAQSTDADEGPSPDIWNIAAFFDSTPTIKIVLWYDWEVNRSEPIGPARWPSVSPNEIVNLPFQVFRSWNGRIDRRYILVGLDDVLWRPTDGLVWAWRERIGDRSPNSSLIDPETPWAKDEQHRKRHEPRIAWQNACLLQLAKTEIDQGFPTLISEEDDPEEVREQLQWTKIEQFGLAQYLANVKDRRAELSADN